MRNAVTLDQVRAAGDLLAPIVRETPLTWSRPLSEHVGGEVLVKCENLQRAGSFKVRGAYVRIHNLAAQESAHGVVSGDPFGVLHVPRLPPQLETYRLYSASIRIVAWAMQANIR